MRLYVCVRQETTHSYPHTPPTLDEALTTLDCKGTITVRHKFFFIENNQETLNISLDENKKNR